VLLASVLDDLLEVFLDQSAVLLTHALGNAVLLVHQIASAVGDGAVHSRDVEHAQCLQEDNRERPGEGSQSARRGEGSHRMISSLLSISRTIDSRASGRSRNICERDRE
jgi:hypothetical protein